nr:unnamed protein product [Callosobruchus analis]
MELKKLHQDLISKLRSTFTINTFTQCIMELVYNSLDANSTAVAVRINFVTYRIQIVDNGDGISKENVSQIGHRYMTNKCEGLKDFQKPIKYYGYRGEALASIMECSKSVNVTSRHKDTTETYSKTLQKNGNEQVSLIRTRPSCGTTITVEGVFYNLAVRRNRIVPELELEDLKTFIQHIIMMHPNVSFTIRDDVSSGLLLNSQKHKDIVAAFKYFHPEIDCDFSLLKVSRNKLTVEALLFKDLYENKNAQYIFVNKRPVYAAKLQKYIVSTISKNRKQVRQKIENFSKVYPVYIVNIKCPHSLVDYNTDQSKTTVDFADWSLIFRYIEKLVYSFFGNEEKLKQRRKPQPLPPDDFIMVCGPSQINGAVKAYGYKRCNKEINAEDLSEKVPKLKKDNIVESTNTDKLIRRKTADSITEKLPTLQIEATVERNEDLGNRSAEKSLTNRICDKYCNDVYHISDTTPQKKSKAPFKKPLPIRITPKSKPQQSCLYTDMKISPAQNTLQNKPTDALSTITHLTNDEMKGKNLIMDMFLKSTQVFNDDESISDGRSEGTIFEVESDMLLENNITSKINGYTKTMSISVNVRSKQKLKRKKCRSKISKCVQTTFRSKSIKSVKVKKRKDDTVKAFEGVHASGSPGEYTVVFSNAMEPDTQPKFRFIPHSTETECDFMKTDDIDLENFCFCKCHSSNNKLFDFHNHERQRATVCNNEDANDQDNINCRRKKQNEQQRDIKNNWKIQHNDQHYPNDNMNENLQFNVQNKHYSDPHRFKQHLDRDFNEENHQLVTDDHQALPAENSNTEHVNRNIKDMYSCQTFGPRKYDKNIVPQPGNQVFRTKHKPQNDSNVRYRNACFNSVIGYDGCTQLQHYTNTKPDFMNLNLNGIVKHNYKKEENYCQQPFPQLNCQNTMYGATKTCHQRNICQNNAIPKLVGSVKKKNQNLNSCQQAFPTQSPYFKQPTSRETNFFHFVEPNGTTLKNHLDVATTQSPYFSKHDRVSHVEADIYNPQELKSRGIYNTEKQSVFHCPSEQTLSKNFDTQFFTHRAYSGEKSQDIFLSSNTQHNFFENNSTIHSFEQFRPEYLSTQIEKMAKETDNVQKHVEELPLKVQDCSTKKDVGNRAMIFPPASSELCITLSNNQKQNLLVEELEQDKMFDVKKFEEWVSQPMKKEQENVVTDGWIKKTDNCGNFYYVNKQTEPVNRSLSQNKKDKLLEYIMETYQTDLMYIKWRKYMDDIDPHVFFDNLYKEKVRQYEERIPNIATLQARDKFRKDQISFNKALLLNVKVIGQTDRKFICVLEPKQNLLILYDQHAVHERVRLEKLLIDYKNSKCKCDEVLVFLPKNHLKLLLKHDKYLNSLGITAEYHTDSISITEIPSYIYNKFKDNDTGSLAKVIRLLIKELVELLRSTRGTTSASLPKFLQDIISLEACRGAIKFGDTLSKEQCTDLLTMLSSCNLPFQCAHGRPTLVPLMHLKNRQENLYVKQKIHFSNIKNCEL